MWQSSAVVCVALAAFVATAVAVDCPPEGFDALKDFNISSYISAPWYVQMQMPLVYQREDDLYCVRAIYEYLDDEDPEAGLLVRNYANRDEVNGEVMGTSTSKWYKLTATIPDSSQPAKLRVGPALFGWNIPNWLRGDYWVVAAGNAANLGPNDPGFPGYDWAIISGGEPGVESGDGCRTGSRWSFFTKWQTNNIGLWLFSRKPVDPEGTAKMLTVATQLGFDTDVLAPVQQAGCLYLDE